MKDTEKTKEQLIEELAELRQRVGELEVVETERKQDEDTLHQYGHIVDTITDMVAFLDEKFTYRAVNKVYAEAFNAVSSEFIGHTVSEVFGEEFFEQVIKSNAGRCLTGETVTYQDWFNFPDYEPRYMEITYYPYLDASHEIRGFVVIGRNITERKQMEEELIRTQRLRAAGELSAGVSHNLNNILSSVLGPAQLLTGMTDDPEILREVEDIISSARRARDLVHRLHLSVRGIEEDKHLPTSINEAIQEAVQTTRPRWKDEPESRGIDIEIEMQLEDVPPIQGTRSRLHDAFTNLIFNAVDALSEGGAITIHTQCVDDRVQLTFSDTGVGMDEETRRRVFEPFFTTKIDIGTGLGLSTVYKTVEQWGGTIEVESIPGKGTTFILQLPIWKGENLEKNEEREERLARPGKVLIIDDDKRLCSVLSRILENDHEVETVTDGRKALDQFVLGRYDVILIDLGMSGLSGNRVAQKIRHRDPLVSTVLITGWELDEGDPRREPFDLQIAKPFDGIDEIRNVVVQAIQLHDERAGGAN